MRHLLGALAVAAASLAAAPAMAVSFTFSFTNVEYGGGAVVGIVSNLVDDATSPGVVAITSNASGYGLGSYDGYDFNTFTLSNGAVTDFNFVSYGNGNSDPATTCCSLALTAANGAGLSDIAFEVAHTASAPVSFTPVTPAPIPLPAPILLLAAGLASLIAMARRQSRRTAVTV
jgi:hypothetical protein